jgi:hypothetical protein
MRWRAARLGALCALVVCAQTSQDPEVARAQAELAHTRALVEAGVTAPAESHLLAERFDGNGRFTPRDFEKISRAYQREFAKSLPVSAAGETALHRALGFDHRGRVDVAINPDQAEGVWLRHFLAVRHIPYFAFRGAMRGKATGPHIHIGPMSGHLAQGG